MFASNTTRVHGDHEGLTRIEHVLRRDLGLEQTRRFMREMRKALDLCERPLCELERAEQVHVCDWIEEREVGLASLLARSMALRLRSSLGASAELCRTPRLQRDPPSRSAR